MPRTSSSDNSLIQTAGTARYPSTTPRRTRRPGRTTVAVAAIAVACLGAVACSKSSDKSAAGSDKATTTTAPEPKVVAPDAVGPFAVGRQTIQVDDTARKRKLDVDVWYPVKTGTTGKPARYMFSAALPTLAFDSKVALDAPPVATADEPFPMVVYSHGAGGFRYIATWYTELLASHGFVVVAPDHTGNTAIDDVAKTSVSREQNEINRLGDVKAVIDDMLKRNTTAGDPFDGTIDPDEIGISGHSFGGFTAIGAVTGFTNKLGTVAPDPRIKAVELMAPYTEPIDDSTLAKLNVPTMVITGTKDTSTPINPMTERAAKNETGRPLYRIDLTDAGHQSFSDVCFYQQLLPTLKDVPRVLTDTVDRQAKNGCATGLLDVDRAQTVANTFLVSFFEAQLAGTKGYDKVLTADGAATFPEAVFTVEK